MPRLIVLIFFLQPNEGGTVNMLRRHEHLVLFKNKYMRNPV